MQQQTEGKSLSYLFWQIQDRLRDQELSFNEHCIGYLLGIAARYSGVYLLILEIIT